MSAGLFVIKPPGVEYDGLKPSDMVVMDLDEVDKMAILTRQVEPNAEAVPQRILDKHYMSKHGPGAYYSQG